MSNVLNEQAISQIAHLARLSENPKENQKILSDLNKIVQMVSQISNADTKNVLPMAHPLDMPQPLRNDEVTEINQRDKLQQLASKKEAGLYLVPVVIE